LATTSIIDTPLNHGCAIISAAPPIVPSLLSGSLTSKLDSKDLTCGERVMS
jgi:hypothetical protein